MASDFYWWLLNSYNNSKIWNVNSDNTINSYDPSFSFGVRPSIYIKNNLSFKGNGTKFNPFTIDIDKEMPKYNYTLINDRISGEYVKLSNNVNEDLFRIIDIENNLTKLVAMEYADNISSKPFATSDSSFLWGLGDTTGTWYDYLVNTYEPYLIENYGNLFSSGKYYFGRVGYNYKLSVCKTANTDKTSECMNNSTNNQIDPEYIYSGNAGLLRIGEMFATSQIDGVPINSIVLINALNTSAKIWRLRGAGYGNPIFSTETSPTRLTIHLSANVKIKSGTGLPNDPYVVGL